MDLRTGMRLSKEDKVDRCTDSNNLTQVVGSPAQGNIEVDMRFRKVAGNVDSTSTGSWPWVRVVGATISVSDNGIRWAGGNNEVSCGFGGRNLVFGALAGLSDRGGMRGNGREDGSHIGQLKNSRAVLAY